MSVLGLSILYVYAFRKYCLKVIMYSVSAQGAVERIIYKLYYYYPMIWILPMHPGSSV